MNKINTEQLILGFLNYLNKDIIPCIEDTFTKVAIRMFTITTETKMEVYKKTLEEGLKNPFVSEFLQADENGCFDIEFLIDALRKAINDCGELTIKIPPVKFISPEEKVLGFNAADISKLKQYLTNEIK